MRVVYYFETYTPYIYGGKKQFKLNVLRP